MKEMSTGTWDHKEKDQSMNEVPVPLQCCGSTHPPIFLDPDPCKKVRPDPYPYQMIGTDPYPTRPNLHDYL